MDMFSTKNTEVPREIKVLGYASNPPLLVAQERDSVVTQTQRNSSARNSAENNRDKDTAEKDNQKESQKLHSHLK